MGGKTIDGCAFLSSKDNFTSFSYGDRTIRFRTPSTLERYTDIVEWNHGYLVVMAKYRGQPAEEEYIDLLPILKNLYIDADTFLAPIRKVGLHE